MTAEQAFRPSPALVTRHTDDSVADRYLLVDAKGAPVWVDDPEVATAFASMREATRMAMRLPAALRAFGLPRDPEVAIHRGH